MFSNVKEMEEEERIVPCGFFKLVNVVQERRTRDGVVNFRVQFRRGELRGRSSTLGVAYNHCKQPLSNVRCVLTCRSDIFHWIFDRYESSDRIERIANKQVEQNKRKEVIGSSRI